MSDSIQEDSFKNVDLNEVVDPKTKVDEKNKEQEKEEPKDASEALSAFSDAPDNEKLETWKQQFGEVLVSGFSSVELFVFRPLSRSEFTGLQSHLAQSEQQVSQLEIEEKICDTCVLWASEPALSSLKAKAGTLTSLHEQIMQASNFMDPRYASNFVVRL